MKKLFYTMLAIAMTAIGISSCEDVPAPYDDPNDHHGGTIVDENIIVEESFSSGFGMFEAITIKGISWTINYNTATATGYNSTNRTNTESESYLVSGEIDLTGVDKAYLTFKYIFRYASNNGEDKVLITDEYTGDPATTEWEDITGNLVEGSDWATFATYAQDIPSRFLGKSAVRIALYYSATEKSSRTWEVKELQVRKGEASEVETDPGPVLPTDLVGDGTADNPYTVADALRIINALGQTESEAVYVKGFVTGTPNVETSFGNATYDISDDQNGSNSLTIYRGTYLWNAPFTSADQIKTGDDVVVYGKLVLFRGDTPEMTQGNYLYSINGDKGKDPSIIEGEALGSGTQSDPYNVTAALQLIQGLEADVNSDYVYVKGIVSGNINVEVSFGNAGYTIIDETFQENKLTVFRGHFLEDAEFTNDNKDLLKNGDEVIIYGQLVNYKGNTPEFAQGNYIYMLNGSTTPVEPGPNIGGTHDNPLTVDEAKAFGTADGAWVSGFIVGAVEIYTDNSGQTVEMPIIDASFQFSTTTNIIIASSPDATDFSQCMAVELPRGAIRTALNLANHYGMAGEQVLLYGKLDNYFGQLGIRATSYAELSDGSPVGTYPQE